MKKDKFQECNRLVHKECTDLADTEEPLNPSRKQHMGTDWQFLGELGLSVGSDAEQRVAVWLKKSLERLDLPEDFVSKILKSAQDAVTRLTRVESVMKIEQLQVSLFIPPVYTQGSQFWGFFRVDKPMDLAQGAVAHGQMIAFYLYTEE